MIFVPYVDETAVINRIHKVRNADYVLLRLTATMIDKNNLDANEFLREMLYNYGVVDYEMLENGGDHGIEFPSVLILPDRTEAVKLKLSLIHI